MPTSSDMIGRVGGGFGYFVDIVMCIDATCSVDNVRYSTC